MMIVAIVLGIVVLALALFCAYVASRPSDFRISRSAIIPASASALFAEVNDLHRWQAWSPWARMDPNAQNSYSGAPSGIGAGMHWKGNSKVGEGKMVIGESRPGELIQISLEFIQPFKATNLVVFTFEPQRDGTLVSWTMTGTSSFIGKAIGLVMNCDKMIGGQYEQGLANLREVVNHSAVASTT